MAQARVPFQRAPVQASCSTALRDLQSPRVAVPHPPAALRARHLERPALSRACLGSVAAFRQKGSPRTLAGVPGHARRVRLLEQFSVARSSIVLYLTHLEKRDVGFGLYFRQNIWLRTDGSL